MLDDVCHRFYGASEGYVEKVMLANPGLVKKGFLLPVGINIDLPDIYEKEDSKIIRLWD